MWLPAARFFCVAYGLILSYLLLTPRPLGASGLDSALWQFIKPLEVGAHFVSAALMATLMMCARWPIPLATTLGLLICYSVGTELIQIVVPTRAFELEDLAQNMAGMFAGLGIFALGSRFVGRSNNDPQPPGSETSWTTFIRVHELNRTGTPRSVEDEEPPVAPRPR